MPWIHSRPRHPKQTRSAWRMLLIHLAILAVYLPILFVSVGLTPEYQWGGPIVSCISTLAAFFAMCEAVCRWG